MTRSLRAFAFLSTLLVLFLTACGGKEDKGPKTPAGGASLDDALALLPGNAIAVGTIDARSFFGSQTFGADLAKLVEKYMPVGEEAGFQASRDVDRVTFASYAYSGLDVAAIVIGKFDEAKIKQAAAAHTPTKTGGTIVASQYAGHDVYTVSNVGFTILSSERAVAGTEQGIRRVLERIKDGRVKRDITPWMLQTVETPGAVAAVAADFATTPMPPDVARQIPVPFLSGLKAARAVATFEAGVQIAGSLTYPDEASAQTASQSIKQAANVSKLLAIFGINVKQFDVAVEKSDVQVKLGVDDQSLRQLLAAVPQWLGQ
jgi:hypothetical protein